MAFTDINSEDRLVQKTFAEHLENVLGWESVYAYNDETFGPNGTLGRADARDAVLTRDLRAALTRLNSMLPQAVIDEAVATMTVEDFILFDASKPGSAREVVARNHQVMGVNNAVDSVCSGRTMKL